jgi:hypothetical protein
MWCRTRAPRRHSLVCRPAELSAAHALDEADVASERAARSAELPGYRWSSLIRVYEQFCCLMTGRTRAARASAAGAHLDAATSPEKDPLPSRRPTLAIGVLEIVRRARPAQLPLVVVGFEGIAMCGLRLARGRTSRGHGDRRLAVLKLGRGAPRWEGCPCLVSGRGSGLLRLAVGRLRWDDRSSCSCLMRRRRGGVNGFGKTTRICNERQHGSLLVVIG